MMWRNDVCKKLIFSFFQTHLPGFLAAVTWIFYMNDSAFNLSTFLPHLLARLYIYILIT